MGKFVNYVRNEKGIYFILGVNDSWDCVWRCICPYG